METISTTEESGLPPDKMRMQVQEREKEVLLSGYAEWCKYPKNSMQRQKHLTSILSNLVELKTSNAPHWTTQKISKWYLNHEHLAKSSSVSSRQEAVVEKASAFSGHVRAFVLVNDEERDIEIRTFRRSQKKRIRLDPLAPDTSKSDSSDAEADSDSSSATNVDVSQNLSNTNEQFISGVLQSFIFSSRVYFPFLHIQELEDEDRLIEYLEAAEKAETELNQMMTNEAYQVFIFMLVHTDD